MNHKSSLLKIYFEVSVAASCDQKEGPNAYADHIPCCAQCDPLLFGLSSVKGVATCR